MKIVILMISVLTIFIGCQEKEKNKLNDKPYKNQVIRVIVPNIGDRVVRGPIMEQAKIFEKKTGAIVRVVTPGWDSTVSKTKESLVDPKINFDIFVIITSWGGSLLGEKHIEPVPTWVKNKIDWDDILPIYKNSILSWNNKIYGLPYDGDSVNLYYRKDIFNDKDNQTNFLKEFGYPLEVPSTWEVYEDVSQFFNNWDWDNDGEIEYGMAGNRSIGFASILQFFSRAASYAKHPDEAGFYFDTNTMEPHINNPGFIKALDDYISIMKYAPKEMINFQASDVRKSFISGEVAMAIDWGDMGTMAANSNISSIKKDIGYAQLPGYKRVYNTKTKKWDEQYNRPSSISGNWTIVINKNSKNKKLAFEFASHMTSPELSKNLISLGWTGINPSRYSHFEDPNSLISMGFNKQSANEYLDVIKISLNNENVMVDIRIPGANEYYNATSKYIDLAIRRELTSKEALDKVALEWKQITDKFGRDKQLKLYNESINNK